MLFDDDLGAKEPQEEAAHKDSQTSEISQGQAEGQSQDGADDYDALLDLLESGSFEESESDSKDLASALDAEYSQIDDSIHDMGIGLETQVQEEEPAQPEESEAESKAEKEVDDGSAWYVVHTFSGYENKVQEGLEKMIEIRGMSKKIKEVKIPYREVEEEKNGKKVITQKKLFPGYVIVRMVMDDEAWYLVRNQRGVTGFVGPNGQKPIPLTKQELDNMGVVKLDEKEPLFSVGDHIEVMEGALKGEVTMIEEVLEESQEVRIRTSILGVNTSTLVGFDKIRKIEV